MRALMRAQGRGQRILNCVMPSSGLRFLFRNTIGDVFIYLPKYVWRDMHLSSEIPLSRHVFLFRSTLGEAFISLPKYPWRDIDFPSGIPLATHFFLFRNTFGKTFISRPKYPSRDICLSRDTRLMGPSKDSQGSQGPARIHEDSQGHTQTLFFLR